MLSVDCSRSIVNIDCAVLQHPKGGSHWKIAYSLLLALPVERLLQISTRKDMWNLMMLMFSCVLIHPQSFYRSVLGLFLYYLLRRALVPVTLKLWFVFPVIPFSLKVSFTLLPNSCSPTGDTYYHGAGWILWLWIQWSCVEVVHLFSFLRHLLI